MFIEFHFKLLDTLLVLKPRKYFNIAEILILILSLITVHIKIYDIDIIIWNTLEEWLLTKCYIN